MCTGEENTGTYVQDDAEVESIEGISHIEGRCRGCRWKDRMPFHLAQLTEQEAREIEKELFVRLDRRHDGQNPECVNKQISFHYM